jgi:hypothetical protein
MEAVERGERYEWWLRSRNNWCPVIHGSVGIAALATLGEIPTSAWVLTQTRTRLCNYLDAFGTDGGCVEGVMYGIYGVGRAALFGAAIRHVTGTDDGILDHPGIARFGSFIVAFTGSDGRWVNFSDCQPRIDMLGDLYALAGYHRDRALDAYLQRYVSRWRRGYAASWEIIFRPADMDAVPVPPAAALTVFPESHWAKMRSETTELFFKSGNRGVGHKHRDLNSFVLVLDRERLVPTAPYRNRGSQFHSTILVNGKGQSRNSTGAIIRTGQTNEVDGVLFVTADASQAYGNALSCFLRTAFFVPDRFVAIADVLRGTPGNTYEWKLQTSREPVIATDGRSAAINGRNAALRVQMVLPGQARLSTSESFGPCLSVDSTASGTDASYFVILAPTSMPVSATANADKVRVTCAGTRYTFRMTDEGWSLAETDFGQMSAR